MQNIVQVRGLSKVYASGHQALTHVDLDIREGEILALLGPNGAGKTTLISIICGIVNASSGSVQVSGHDIVEDYRAARSIIGLVPQELTINAFEKVWDDVSFSRGLHGRAPDPSHIEKILRDLSLWEKKDSMLMALSGGMKRRVLIAKALSHEPKILFLDEPSAGVDVALRKGMWETIYRLRDTGVTIILTTHYIEEAEEMADRVGVINHGELLLLEDKASLMQKMGRKTLSIELHEAITQIPAALADYPLELSAGGKCLDYHYDNRGDRTGITRLLTDVAAAGLRLSDLHTKQSTLEEIFVTLVSEASS